MPSGAPGYGLSVGVALGHYRLTEKIGEGATGQVYRALDDRLEREVAIKVLAPGILADDAARERFREEARSLSRLNHPNVATLHHFETEGCLDYLVMEYIPGETLRGSIARAPLEPDEIVRIGTQVAQGLSAAHEQGLVHCDLKPENLRARPDGTVKILDFGVAMLARPAADVRTTTVDSQARTVRGTVPYMSPEQVLGKPLDARSDIFSLGVVLYELATRSLPFDGNTVGAVCDAILHKTPVRPLALRPNLPPQIESIVLTALEKQPDKRYQTAQDLAVDLQLVARGTKTGLSSADNRRSPSSALRRASALLVACAVLVLLVGLWATGWLSQGGGQPAGQGEGTVPSVAVLPFMDLSPAQDQQYFSDGLAEELLGTLSGIEELRVAGRTSSFQFHGKNDDLREIGRKLGVGAILEGSVRRQGDRVRITATLTNAANGFQLWGETFDRQIDDIFAVEEDIARSVAARLRVTLVGAKRPASKTGKTEAYTDYLLGRYYLGRSSAEDIDKALDYYRKAIRLEPAYASAWAGVGAALFRQASTFGTPVPDRAFAEARQAVERALALEPELVDAHVTLASIRFSYDWDWTGADRSLRRAMEIEPRNARVLTNRAHLSSILGRPDEALAIDRRAEELDPLNLMVYYNHGVHAYNAGRTKETIAAFGKALALNPAFPIVHTMLGRAYLADHRPVEALAEMERETDPTWRLYGLALARHALKRTAEADASVNEMIAKHQAEMAFQIAEVFAFRGEADRAFAWLDRALLQRDNGLTQIRNPLFANIERDSRYAAFLAKMRLPPLSSLARTTR